ncbi:MAG TPA: SDR family NAD(P)-dependent oxidoreductase, partial [Acidobacteriota bacterium]|nr:SDR family NAD(P)-dependent oxidoreductase [Acidobacteriota bacterium]
SQAALAAIQAVRKAGGTAHYHSLDLTGGEAVARVISEIRDRHGRIDVLMHAAGLEISRMIPDKKQTEFDLVFDVKSDGWFNLISGIGAMDIGAAVVFSSIAGRFGNAGQADYSSANDLLCKCISNLRSSRPSTRGIAIDWTAWSGIGMAARGSIPAVMKQAGIDMLPPEAGIPVVRRELTSGTRGELVIGNRLGIMLRDFDPQGGLDTAGGSAIETIARSGGVMTGNVRGMSLYNGLTVETELDPAKQPFLYDHRISDIPVLPGVMGIEAMAETARLLYPEKFIGAIEDVRFLSPFKFYRHQPRTITVCADYYTDGEDILAECRLLGSRMLHGHAEPEITTHFSGRVRLVSNPPKGEKKKEAPGLESAVAVGAEEIYRIYFHGPAYQVIAGAWRAGEQIVGRFAETLPPNHQPEESPLVTAPRLVELCFQTASLSGLALQSRLGLPFSFRELKVAAPLENVPKVAFLAIVDAHQDGCFDAELVDEKGKIYLILRGYRTMDLPDSVRQELVEPLREALKR